MDSDISTISQQSADINPNRLDIIIFGATGFTGKRTIPQLIHLIKSENLAITWGIAGRSEKKLKDALLEIKEKTGEDYSDIPIIYADSNNIESLEKMSSRARVIINAVGPYRFFGEQVVQACVKTGTHYVDVCGEPQFMDAMQLKYHTAALEKKVYLISACGLDSIPADLGAIFLQKNFDGAVNSIETYLYMSETGGPYPGATIHYTTYESAVYGLAHANELRALRAKLYPKRLPPLKPTLQLKGMFFKSELVNKWCTVFPGADRSVMSKTQRYMYETQRQRPAQIQTYCGVKSFFQLFILAILGTIFSLMCKFNFTRNILLKHPKVFTFGAVSHEGPSDEKQENTYFHMVLYGEGWSEKMTEPTDNYDKPPNKVLTAKVSGKNPGYGATCIALALSAVTILTETDKMPNSGGWYTPGAAFANTSLIEMLNKYGVTFELDPKL